MNPLPTGKKCGGEEDIKEQDSMSVGTIYEMVTEKVLAAIESTGELPWRKPWTTYADGSVYPRNLVTGRFYSGINVVLLGTQYYESPFWLTLKQCGDAGGRVRKGEKGSMILYWKLLERKSTKEGKEITEKIPMIRYSTVFNSSQCDGIAVPELRNRLNKLQLDFVFSA